MDAGVDTTTKSPPTTAILLEPRPFRPFKTSEEYLWAMKEDLAEWLHSLYGLEITADDFLDSLETGVTLCQHANHVRRLALSLADHGRTFPASEVTYRADVQAGTFQARDNVSNFISWCRGLGIIECLLFETEDLVMRKNERSFILCLLEVARRGAKFGMPAPLLVQMEEEIDREIEKEKKKIERSFIGISVDEMTSSEEEEEDEGPPLQIITNDLKSLDEMVRDLVNRCNCPVQFPMIRVSEGKYRIGDTQVLIFVRILRSHVMVRVGGGWDTLEHYLDKHDPCRCRQGHRSTVSSKFIMKHTPNQTQMQVTYERSPDPNRVGVKGHYPHPPSSPQRIRRSSLSSNPSTGSLASTGSERERYRKSSGDGVPASRTPDASSRRLSDGDVYLRMTCDPLDEGYFSGSKNPLLIKKPQHQLPTNSINKPSTLKQCKKEPSDCSSGISTDHDTKLESPDSGELTDEDKKKPIPKKTSRHLDNAKQAIDRLSRKKSQSTEELGLTTLSIPPSASTQTLRRHSSGKSTIPATMTRSRSQYSEESEMAKYLTRLSTGRNSYRTPTRSTPPSNKTSTWAHRQRSTRPAVNSETFNKPLTTKSNSPSPQRRSKSGPPQSSFHVTPNKTVLPLVKEVLTATSTPEEFIRKMAEMVAKHGPLDLPDDPVGLRYTDDWVASTAARSRRLSGASRSSPGDESGSDGGDCYKDQSVVTGPYVVGNGEKSRIPVRVNPRKDNVPGSTRIPAPTYYKK